MAIKTAFIKNPVVGFVGAVVSALWEAFWIVGPPVGIDLGVNDATRQSYFVWGGVALGVSLIQIIVAQRTKLNEHDAARLVVIPDLVDATHTLRSATDGGIEGAYCDTSFEVVIENGEQHQHVLVSAPAQLLVRRRKFVTTLVGDELFSGCRRTSTLQGSRLTPGPIERFNEASGQVVVAANSRTTPVWVEVHTQLPSVGYEVSDAHFVRVTFQFIGGLKRQLDIPMTQAKVDDVIRIGRDGIPRGRGDSS